MPEITAASGRGSRAPQLLADEFYLSGLDDMTGEQRLQPHALAVGLAAAVLGELLLADRMVIDGGRLRPFDEPCADELQERVRQWIRKDDSVVLAKDWIRVLVARQVADLVRHRMHAAGKVVRTTRRRLLRKPLELYVPPSLSTAVAAGVRIAGNLGVPRDLSPTDLLLAGLLRATGRDRDVLSHCEPTVHDELTAQLRRNVGPSGTQLLEHATEVLVTEAVTPQF
ncbi:GPP34 family phosphoprotein [Actinokineospora auranticolor]|uniref:Golgi phosphoprotein 3 GPP34 n=1 Tax=Actinokineospora auranticolor TaxID=155976 RepID=A0A2S6GPK9_9PSEU|nr:GPP34 family phosphoprotein [Actinokineospora auranticolor]PPK67164.1 Golgi phosphoprotein 3 GPP34 [Actinokineospora auranticolor]